jgi:PAS domain S-box-containing protein
VNSSQLPDSHLIPTLKSVPKAASAIVIFVSCLVIVGWMLDIPTFKSVLPSLVTMKANTALAFLLSGVSLWLLQKKRSRRARRLIAQVCALIVATIGLLTLSQYLFNWNLGIDQLVFREIEGVVGTSHPGRMAPNTALNFLLLGCALLLLSHRTHRNAQLLQFLTLTVALVCLQPLLGYTYGVELLYGIASYTQMALHTVLTFIVLCVGILLVPPYRGVMGIVMSDSTGGFIARRLLLAAIAIPFLLGYFIVQGYRLGFYHTTFGLSILVMVSIVVFTIWILQNAQTLNRIDNERFRAKQALQESEERYRAFIEQSSEGIWRFELEQPISVDCPEDEQIEQFYQHAYLAECNNAMAQMYGFSTAQDMIGVRLPDLLVRSDPQNIEYLRNFIRSGYRLNDAETHEIDKQGLAKFFLNNLVGIVDKNCLVRAWGSQRDITERKRTQAALQESEKRFRRLVESNIFGVAFGDFSGGIHYANDYFLNMLGYEREDLRSGQLQWDRMTPPEFLHLDALAAEELKTDGVATPFEKEYIRKDGTHVPILIGGALLQEPYDQDQEIITFHLDLTEHKRAELALRESEERFRKFFEEAPIGISVVDLDGKFLEVNKTYCEMLGYHEQELNQLTFAAITHPDDVEIDWRYKEQLFKGEIPKYQLEKRYIKKNEEIVWINLTATAICDQSGKPRYGLGMVEDIGERKRNQALLAAQNHVLEMIAKGTALPEVLTTLTEFIEEQADEAVCSILLLNQEGTKLYIAAAPSLPDSYKQVVIEGVSIGSCEGSCGTAAYHREPVIVSDIANDPLWAAYRDLPLSHGLQACWSTPIFASNGDLLGTFGMYYRTPRSPSDRDRKLVELFTHLAGVAIERQRAETSLQETNQTLQALIEACPLAITVFSLDDGKVKMWNPAAERIFGWSEQEALGCFLPSVPEHKQDEFLANLTVVRQGQALTAVETRRQKKDGSPIDISVWAAPLHDAQGNFSCMSIIADISDRKRLEAEREQLLAREQAARADAEAANRTKDEFLATLSHELRTPLNAMLGWTQMLCTRKFDEATTTRALETIDRNTKSLAALIEDVLDVSRIIRGKLHLNIRPVHLISVVEAALDTVRPAAQAKGIQLESRLDSSVEPLLGDGNRLQQVVWNLLSNAVKFTPKGGRVEIRLERHREVGDKTSSYVLIQVTDTGKGIAPEFLPYVFDRFRQENSSTTRSYGGLGLGLAIVRHLVELHGGTVYAQSPGEGQGATFSVQLPLRSILPQVSDESSVDSTSQEYVPFNTLPTLEGLRVLVVEDEADTRELLITILRQYGIEVTAVASAGEALEALQQLKLDVMVSDIGMPGEDGYSLMRKVRALNAQQGGQIPAVALTAYARAEDRISALAAGFQLHMPKPVNPEELAAVVANLAGRTGKR